MILYLYSCFSVVIHFAFVSNRDNYSCVRAKIGMFGDAWCNTRNLFAFQWFSKCSEPLKTIKKVRRKLCDPSVILVISAEGMLSENYCQTKWLDTITNDTTMKIENYLRIFLFLNLLNLFSFNLVLVLCTAVADSDLELRGRIFVACPDGFSSLCGSFFSPK